MNAALHIRLTPDKGRGLFASETIAAGAMLVAMSGQVYHVDDLPEEGLAMQVGDDLWLHSSGDLLDDCGNHSCEPNAGFVTGEPILYALREIAAGEEVCWDYSTSIAHEEWSLKCRCGQATCREIVLPWGMLSPENRERLRGIALSFLRAR